MAVFQQNKRTITPDFVPGRCLLLNGVLTVQVCDATTAT